MLFKVPVLLYKLYGARTILNTIIQSLTPHNSMLNMSLVKHFVTNVFISMQYTRFAKCVGSLLKLSHLHYKELPFVSVLLSGSAAAVVYKQAEALRLECKCPALKTHDPRSALAHLQQQVTERNIAKQSDSTSPKTSSNIALTAARDPVPLARPKS